MGLRLNEESRQIADINKIIHSIPIPKNKLDLDHFLDSLFDHALESGTSLRKLKSKGGERDYENFINSIGDGYSYKFSSKLCYDSNNLNLSARIKGGPSMTCTTKTAAATTTTTKTKRSSAFIQLNSGYNDAMEQTAEKKSIVKLVKHTPSSLSTIASSRNFISTIDEVRVNQLKSL